jgi:hypothetical protein
MSQRNIDRLHALYGEFNAGWDAVNLVGSGPGLRPPW